MMNEITWGDAVLISLHAPAEFQPGAQGSVCGFRDVKQHVGSGDGDSSSEQRLYLVEFPNGTAIEIPAYLLGKVTDG